MSFSRHPTPLLLATGVRRTPAWRVKSAACILFQISPEPGAHLRVEKDPESGRIVGRIVGRFRDDVLETLGGEKALHAYLVLNHPEWDGGEGGLRLRGRAGQADRRE